MTGNSVNNAFNCIDQINAILPSDKPITPWISTSCGSTIINPEREIINEVNLPRDYIFEIIAKAEEIDPKVVFMYRSGDTNYIEKQNTLSKGGILLYIYRYKESRKGSAGVKLTNIAKSSRNFLIRHNNIQNLYIVTANEKIKETLDKELIKVAKKYSKNHNTNINVYPGFVTQTPARSKTEALKLILDMNPNMCPDVSDVIYFGDGNNDVECLTLCKYSFARGPEANTASVNAAKYRYDNLSSVADALYSDKTKFEKNMRNLPKYEECYNPKRATK